jgi:M6 family metalloprotease-like protein
LLRLLLVCCCAAPLFSLHAASGVVDKGSLRFSYDDRGIAALGSKDDPFGAEVTSPEQPLSLAVHYKTAVGDWLTNRNRFQLAISPETNTLKYTLSDSNSPIGIVQTFNTDGKTLDWNIDLENLAKVPLTIGDLAVSIPSVGPAGENPQQIFEHGFIKHQFISGHGSFLYFVRASGAGPFLIVTVRPGTKLEYFGGGGGGRGGGAQVYIHSALTAGNEKRGTWRQPNTFLTLGPAGAKDSQAHYAFRFQFAKTYDAMREVLFQEGLFDIRAVPGMTVPIDLPARFSLRTRASIGAIQSEFPADTKIIRLPDPQLNTCLFEIAFNQLGENRLTIFHDGGRKTYLEYFVTEPLETLIKKRSAFLINRQQIHDPSNWWDGVFGPYDMKNQVVRTINGYWMEQSRGKFGITQLEAFGPYLMPTNFWYYGLNEHRQNTNTPTGVNARGNTEQDADALWWAAAGKSPDDYDCVLRIYAGYDETGVWQEFGEMKFETRDDIPVEWGNPNTNLQRWVPTRYVPWTSWRAGAQHWGLSTIRQGENSGTITHELGHFAFGIGDNNNNSYVHPYRRVGSGPWDMMDRGSFNGPGGPHSRWVVPATQGAAMPAGLMLRNRIINGFITNAQILRLNRDGLAQSGLAVATVTARAVEPNPGELAGIVVTLVGPAPRDRTPIDDPATNALSSGRPVYNNYTLEVVQRLGYDSFCPDSGVLLAKNKDREGAAGGPNSFNLFSWVIDAHPGDINMVDFKRPKSGSPVMRTIADYRQLNDALFHAGLNSGSQYEYEDPYNRLHFYIIDVLRDARGILSYTLGVRSLDGAGPQTRGAALDNPAPVTLAGPSADCFFQLRNPGAFALAAAATIHPQDATDYLKDDIYRLTVSVEGAGWSAQLRNALAAVPFGQSANIPVYVTRAPGASSSAVVTLTAKSESDPAKTATATCQVKGFLP